MSKQLYEEALADVKRIKEVAEANAKRAVVEAVAPRIRELIESELLGEGVSDGPVDPVEDQVTTIPMQPAEDIKSPADALTVPDEDGKVTLDLDALSCSDTCPGQQLDPLAVSGPVDAASFDISFESIEALEALCGKGHPEVEVLRLSEDVSGLVGSGAPKRSKIMQMISRVENMYDHVQEVVSDPALKSSCEEKLESHFSELNELLEQTMSMKNMKNRINEEDVTLKLTGLPDDLDLDSVGVDLITGEEDEESGDSEDLDLDAMGDEDSGGEDMGLPPGEDEEPSMGESLRNLPDDTIVEIDEGMLKREIARIKKLRALRESADGAGVESRGDAAAANVLDDFGGGGDDGDAWLDHDVTTEMDEPEDDEEVLETESAQRRASLKRRLGFERRLQERSKRKADSLKREARRASYEGDDDRVASLKKDYAAAAKRFNESLQRAKKISTLLAESNAKKGAKNAKNVEADNLRKKLAETNLLNAKLVYTNKLLQNEKLTSSQKVRVIEQLRSAKTVREAKLVYESSACAMETSQPVNEGAARRAQNSASRATRKASTTVLTEGATEADRWARLAGIQKK